MTSWRFALFTIVDQRRLVSARLLSHCALSRCKVNLNWGCAWASSAGIFGQN